MNGHVLSSGAVILVDVRWLHIRRCQSSHFPSLSPLKKLILRYDFICKVCEFFQQISKKAIYLPGTELWAGGCLTLGCPRNRPEVKDLSVSGFRFYWGSNPRKQYKRNGKVRQKGEVESI